MFLILFMEDLIRLVFNHTFKGCRTISFGQQFSRNMSFKKTILKEKCIIINWFCKSLLWVNVFQENYPKGKVHNYKLIFARVCCGWVKACVSTIILKNNNQIMSLSNLTLYQGWYSVLGEKVGIFYRVQRLTYEFTWCRLYRLFRLFNYNFSD